jgi:hypothetical protein
MTAFVTSMAILLLQAWAGRLAHQFVFFVAKREAGRCTQTPRYRGLL